MIKGGNFVISSKRRRGSGWVLGDLLGSKNFLFSSSDALNRLASLLRVCRTFWGSIRSSRSPGALPRPHPCFGKISKFSFFGHLMRLIDSPARCESAELFKARFEQAGQMGRSPGASVVLAKIPNFLFSSSDSRNRLAISP